MTFRRKKKERYELSTNEEMNGHDLHHPEYDEGVLEVGVLSGVDQGVVVMSKKSHWDRYIVFSYPKSEKVTRVPVAMVR